MLEYSRALVAALPETTVIVVRADESVWVAEGRLLQRAGEAPGAFAGRPLSEILPAADEESLRGHLQAALTGSARGFEYRAGEDLLLWVELTPLYFGADEPVAVTAVVQDLTERHLLGAELNTERERRLIAEQTLGIGHWRADLQAQTITLSEGLLALAGIESEPTVELRRVLACIEPGDRDRVTAGLLEAARRGEFETETVLLAPDGTRRRVFVQGRAAARVDGRSVITGTAVDITILRDAERERNSSEALMRQAFDRSPIGMSFLDPRTARFMQVNDALCRLVGRSREELLQMTVMDVSHPEDAAIDRAGPPEIPAGSSDVEIERRYLTPDGDVIPVRAHVSLVLAGDGSVRSYFVQILDMTAIKEREAMLAQEAADLKQAVEIRTALAEDRFLLHAQPIVDLRTGETVQRELLVRMRGVDGELVAPGEFLPAAERQGCIREIDRWVTTRGIELAARGLPVEVNLSARSIGDECILVTIREALARTGARPELVVFEVTETALMADVERGREFAQTLRELGCQFALDDFGTGYGTFTYLKHMPADYIKIDIEFVRDLLTSSADESVVRAVVAMARDLGKTTIAEGVEDAATLERLRELGVDHAQGYFLGRPEPIELDRR